MTDRASVERDVTLVIKTFERPHSVLRLIESVRTYYPRLKIVVVDDSAEPLDPVPQDVDYCRLPFNSGAAMGRNVGFGRVETPYLLLADDDHVFGPETDLQAMMRVLRETRFDLVASWSIEHRQGTDDVWLKAFAGTFEIVDGVYVQRPGAARGRVDGLPVYDIVLDFFMASRERLGDDPWDPRLKIGTDHADFFMTLKQRGVLCTALSGVAVHHLAEWSSPRYMSFRTNTEAYFEIWRQKWGIKREVQVVSPVGWTARCALALRHRIAIAAMRVRAFPGGLRRRS